MGTGTFCRIDKAVWPELYVYIRIYTLGSTSHKSWIWACMPLKAQRLSSTTIFTPHASLTQLVCRHQSRPVQLACRHCLYSVNILIRHECSTMWVYRITFHCSSPSHLQSINAFAVRAEKENKRPFGPISPTICPSWAEGEREKGERHRRGSASSRSSEVSLYSDKLRNWGDVKSV